MGSVCFSHRFRPISQFLLPRRGDRERCWGSRRTGDGAGRPKPPGTATSATPSSTCRPPQTRSSTPSPSVYVPPWPWDSFTCRSNPLPTLLAPCAEEILDSPNIWRLCLCSSQTAEEREKLSAISMRIKAAKVRYLVIYWDCVVLVA